MSEVYLKSSMPGGIKYKLLLPQYPSPAKHMTLELSTPRIGVLIFLPKRYLAVIMHEHCNEDALERALAGDQATRIMHKLINRLIAKNGY